MVTVLSSTLAVLSSTLAVLSSKVEVTVLTSMMVV
jgi:hypothetical protein